MLVGERDDEAVEPVGLELLAKRLQAVCITGHARFLILRGNLNKRPDATPESRLLSDGSSIGPVYEVDQTD